jgi:serine/threonine protein kinase
LRNRYRPIQSLGGGGFAKTYLAEDVDKLNEKCVIKQFAPQIQGTAGRKKATELFLQEALQLLKLGKHSQIPTLLAYFEENNRLYLVQEFIDGENLLEELEKQGIFSESKIRALLQDLLTTLKVVHEYGVIHRDIKPENIMRRRSDGKLILIDFGASKQLQGTVRTGTSIGTFGYAPLEQMRDGKVYPASDLYSLGATCFHLLTGVHPGELYQEYGYEWVKTWRVHLQKPVNSDLDTVLDKLLQKYYQQRYQSAQAVLQDLKNSQLTTKTTYQASHKSSQIPSQQQKSPSQTSPIQIKSKQNSIIPKRRISQPNNSLGIIMWSSIGVFVLGIVFLGTQSAHIPIICKSLDNCAVDEKFSSQYEQGKDIAVTAQKLSESAKNVEELQASQQQLKDAIAQLKTIPTSAKIYNTAQNELSDYQTQLTKIQRRLDKENQAIDSINQAKQQAQDAEEQMGKAQTVSEYEAVKDKLQQAIATLNDIPSDTLISERVTNLKESYQSKRQEVDKIIEELNKPKPSPTSEPTDPPDPPPFPANDIKSPQWSYEVFNSNSDSGSSRLIGKPNFDQQKREVEWLVEYSTISRSNNETSPNSPLYKINKDLELLLVQQEIEGIGFFAEFKYSNGVSLGKAKLNREGTGNRIRYSLRISDNIWQKWSEISQVIITK